MAVSLDGQWEVDGLLLGRGTPYPIEGVQGLGSPEVKVNDHDRATADGGYAGTDRLGPREVLLLIGIDGDPDSTDYGERVDALGEVFSPRAADVVASYQRFGRRRRLYARPRGLVLPWDDDFHLGAAKAVGRLFAQSDPVVYDDDESQTTSGGTFTVTNDGNYKAWPLLTVNGPGGTVVLTNNTLGRSVTLVGLGGTAAVDPRRATVTVGGSDAYGTVQARPQWWWLEAGANSITVTGATSLTVTWRHGWTTG